jgi:predicted carbohydrate-binding protein with CBM5 and CBM33 domain
MTIEYHETNPDGTEYFKLFQTTGWNEEYQLTLEELERASGRITIGNAVMYRPCLKVSCADD